MRAFHFLLAALISTPSISAVAPDWKGLEAADGTTNVWVDADSVVTTDDTVSFWIKNEEGYYPKATTLRQVLIDCRLRTIQVVGGVRYSEGRVIQKDLGGRPGAKEALVPGTTFDVAREAFCTSEALERFQR